MINFIPDMQLALQAQFDNISRGFGFSARYRWEYEPGNEIFVAIGQGALIPGTTFKTGHNRSLRFVSATRSVLEPEPPSAPACVVVMLKGAIYAARTIRHNKPT